VIGRFLPFALLAGGALLTAGGLHAALWGARPRSFFGCLLAPIGVLAAAGGLYLALAR
jgi:hypothetical protein